MDIGIYPPHINALPSIQLKELKYVAQWLERETPFYHKKFRDANVNPSDIKNLGDIKKLPLTTKAEVKALPNIPRALQIVITEDSLQHFNLSYLLSPLTRD